MAPGVTPQVGNLQEHIRKDGVRKVDGPGTLRHDCPPSPAVDAEKDCFVYRLFGQPGPPARRVERLNARLRVWVARAGDHWEVVNYDYGVIR